MSNEEIKPINLNDYGYFSPDEVDGTAVCQCGVRKPIKELSQGYAGFTERSKPCYFCGECIPF